MTLYVAGVVKRLTRRIVAPLCVGSSPTTRPIFFYPKSGKGMKKFTGSFIWGYRQAVRQRTLTPLSVVRLHLPLPVHGSCSSPLQDFLRGNKSLSRPVVSALLWWLAPPPFHPQFGGAAKGKRLDGQARRLTSPHLEVLCRTSTGDYKAPLCLERLMKGLLCGALLSHRSAGGRWCRKAPKGGKPPEVADRRNAFLSYDTESKSRNADFISIAAERQSTTLSAAGAVAP